MHVIGVCVIGGHYLGVVVRGELLNDSPGVASAV